MNYRKNIEINKSDRGETIALSLVFVCGLSAPKEAMAAPETIRTTLSEQRLREAKELEEQAPIAHLIDAVADADIRAEGYKGDIAVLKKRAKSQIPLLYGSYEFAPSYPYPLINVEVFTKGISIYYAIPDQDVCMRTEYSRSDIESAIHDIEQKLQLLTGMRVRRAERQEDATIPFVFFEQQRGKRIRAYVESYFSTPPATTFFPPIGTVCPIDFVSQNESIGGVRVPLIGIEDYSRSLPYDFDKKYSKGAKRFIRSRELIEQSIHEILHAIGFSHSEKSGHILAKPRVNRFAKLSSDPTTASVEEGDELFDDENGDRYMFRAFSGDLKKSPLVDMFLFLRIFMKQHKENMLQKEGG